MCGVKFTTTNEDADLLVKATGSVPNLCEEDFPFLERDVGDITKPMGAAHAIAKAKSACQCIVYNGMSATLQTRAGARSNMLRIGIGLCGKYKGRQEDS
mgnify:CR=1 FL=1|jgi:hypothetical protein